MSLSLHTITMMGTKSSKLFILKVNWCWLFDLLSEATASSFELCLSTGVSTTKNIHTQRLNRHGDEYQNSGKCGFSQCGLADRLAGKDKRCTMNDVTFWLGWHERSICETKRLAWFKEWQEHAHVGLHNQPHITSVRS